MTSSQSVVALSIVIPFYNEEEGVEEVIRRTIESCKRTGESFEVIAVNDGSRDGTLARLISLSEKHPQLRILNLWRNFGHMPALTAGLTHTTGQAIVVLDGDLQDPPELIGSLVEEWKRGADVAYGKRTDSKDVGLKKAGSSMFYWLMGLVSEIDIPKNVGTYSLMTREVVDMISAMPEKCRFFTGIRAWVGGKQVEVSYCREQRRHGSSRVGLRGLVRLARGALISFSGKPLRYISAFAFLASFILLLVGMVAIAIRLFTDLAIPGWATFTTLQGFLGCVLSFVLAIFAEYISVIFEEVKGRPVFLIREEYRVGTPHAPSQKRGHTVVPL
ncbi:glycosyltransferase family 2 protein [Patescibacteria group bacterium]|nr:glycosyltransferase family 2 protein [Patescibacteria group bacterium]MBU2260116.1 glycosyltransferase family 2 protein [Patescibacteria group bacterium]